MTMMKLDGCRIWPATKLTVAVSLVCLSAGACKSHSSHTLSGPVAIRSESPAPSVVPATPAAELGSVSGTVLFAGKPPAPVHIDTSMDPACSLAGGPDVMSEQYAVAGGKLQNVFVTVESGPDEAMHAALSAAAPVILDQKGCRYIPHAIALEAGGSVEFRNSDPTMHNIHTMPATAGNEVIDVSQSPRGTPIVKRFDKPETMLPVRCNNHPWMNAFINVAKTRFFAVTDASGHFDLRELPPGAYTLTATHEKLGQQTIQVTVPAGGSAKASFTFAAR